MSDILNKNIVRVLNKNWQAINSRTPADAFCQMGSNVATQLSAVRFALYREHAKRRAMSVPSRVFTKCPEVLVAKRAACESLYYGGNNRC